MVDNKNDNVISNVMSDTISVCDDIFISIVICAYSLKRFEMIIDCIDSISHNDYKNYEIILVIDGNKDLKQKMDDKYKGIDNITIIENNKNEGPSVSRNRGVEIAKGDIIAFIDDDAFAEYGWLERIIKNFSDNPKIDACGGKLLPMYDEGAKMLPEELLWTVGCTYKGHPVERQFVRNVISANMAVRKKVFKDIKFEKMFDGKNWKMEDTLFGLRLSMRRKDAILYDPDMIVHHNVSRDRTKLKYIIERSYSEGKLKYDLGHMVKADFTDKKVFSQEQNYLKILLLSIIRNSFTLRLKNALLITMVMSTVMYGYVVKSEKTNLKKLGESLWMWTESV